jgi:hypothetical protein
LSTTPLGARTRVYLTCLLLLSATLLAGCGGEDDPSPSPASSDSPTSTSGPTSAPTSASADSSQSPSPSESVPPAAGKTVETSFFTVSAPQGWEVHVVAEDFVVTASDPDSSDTIAFKIIEKGGAQPGLRALANDAVEFGTWPGGKAPAIVAETELGGEPAYHLTGSGGGARVDARGTLHGTSAVSIGFEIYGSQTELESIVESVLATWQWK